MELQPRAVFGTLPGTMRRCASFEAVTTQPEEVVQALSGAVEQTAATATGALVFLSGAIARMAARVAVLVAARHRSIPCLIATGSGVMTERGEHEQVSAAVGLVWRGGSASTFAFDASSTRDVGRSITREARERMQGKSGALALFACREAVPPHHLFDSRRDTEGLAVFGAGTAGSPGIYAVQDGRATSADVGAMVLAGLAPPVVRASTACELLGALQPVTQIEEGLVLRIGQQTAIEALRSQATRLQGRKLVVLAVDVNAEKGRRPRLMVRAIRGLHESRGGLMISEDIAVNTRIAFATLDAQAARTDLEVCLREIAREAHGGEPLFGLYMNCSGREQQLYGEPNVDSDLIRSRWRSLPFAGLMSSFEIGPGRQGATAHLYSGVFSLSSAPS